MNSWLASYLEQWIDQDILDERNLYSLDSMTPSQLRYEREEYAKALFKVIEREMDK